MQKRKTKPDLMFLLTVFVCLGVLVTATVNASDVPQQGWAMTVSAESDCQRNTKEWQACAGWQGLAGTESPAQGATVRFFHEHRSDLGLVWYYSQKNDNKQRNINVLHRRSSQAIFSDNSQYSTQFGVALRQQYRHFGFSVGLESEKALLNQDAVLYFGVNNRW